MLPSLFIDILSLIVFLLVLIILPIMIICFDIALLKHFPHDEYADSVAQLGTALIFIVWIIFAAITGLHNRKNPYKNNNFCLRSFNSIVLVPCRREIFPVPGHEESKRRKKRKHKFRALCSLIGFHSE